MEKGRRAVRQGCGHAVSAVAVILLSLRLLVPRRQQQEEHICGAGREEDDARACGFAVSAAGMRELRLSLLLLPFSQQQGAATSGRTVALRRQWQRIGCRYYCRC